MPARAVLSDGRGRPRAVPRCSAAAFLCSEVGQRRATQSRQQASRGATEFRAVPLRLRQRVNEQEAKELYEKFSVPGSGAPIFQAATANINPFTEAKIDTKNPDRGPLLITSGEKDHQVPWAISHSSYKHQQHNPGVTEIVESPDGATR